MRYFKFLFERLSGRVKKVSSATAFYNSVLEKSFNKKAKIGVQDELEIMKEVIFSQMQQGLLDISKAEVEEIYKKYKLRFKPDRDKMDRNLFLYEAPPYRLSYRYAFSWLPRYTSKDGKLVWLTWAYLPYISYMDEYGEFTSGYFVSGKYGYSAQLEDTGDVSYYTRFNRIGRGEKVIIHADGSITHIPNIMEFYKG